MDVDRQDAFSRTLESRPRQRGSLARSQSRTSTAAFSEGRENAVDRLSRVFEQDRRSSADIAPAVTTTHVAPKRPPPPTKPPSLRAPSYNNNRAHDPLPSPSSESLISPSSTGTVATSVTSYASDVQSHRRSLKDTEDNLPEQKEHNSNIDETPLAFQDIRAKFQQKENVQSSLPFPKRPESTYIRNNRPDYSKAPPPSIPAKPLVRPPRPSSIENNNNNNNTNLDSDTRQVPRTGTFVAELSKLLEHNVEDDESPKLPIRRPSPPPRSSVLRKTSGRTTDSSSRPPNINKNPSTNGLNSPSSSTVLHLPAIARTGTGNSTASTSSASSSLATTESQSKRAWHYGTALASWLTGHDHHHHSSSSWQQNSPSIKDSIIITSKEPATPATEDRPVSGSDTVTSYTTTSLPVSPQPSGKPQQQQQQETSRKVKRAKVVQELIETERSYQNDMMIVKEVYYDRACASTSPLDKSDVKTLFSNLLDITRFEDEFVTRLEQATCAAADNVDGDNDDDDNDDSSPDGTTVGLAFREMMEQIDAIYCEYCKNHEDAVLRLQELESKPDTQPFFDECRRQMQGLTTSWDLGSLLIKPVQRVLKYPLLLREIFLLTPADHPDHDDLAAATQEIQHVADHINEIKRRKDIVEKIVGDKKKSDINVVHGINKKLTRRAQQFKQATGFSAEATQDALFDALYLQFEEQQEIARQLARDIQGWVRQVKNHFENLRLLAESLESLYGSWGGVRVKSLRGFQDFTKATAMYSSAMTRELDTKVQSYVYPRIDDFLKVFDNPMQVIRKRAQKLLDYDRARDIKSKGDTPDKTLQESADAYVSINAQLVDELPKFFKLTAKYFDILVGDLANVQHQFYYQMAQEWQKLLDRHLSR